MKSLSSVIFVFAMWEDIKSVPIGRDHCNVYGGVGVTEWNVPSRVVINKRS